IGKSGKQGPLPPPPHSARLAGEERLMSVRTSERKRAVWLPRRGQGRCATAILAVRGPRRPRLRDRPPRLGHAWQPFPPSVCHGHLGRARDRDGPPRLRQPWHLAGVLLLVLLGGLLAFCHGCHGNEDDGLSVRDWWVRAVGR